MALASVPFDLVDVKLAAPSARPGTVTKLEAIGRLCESTLPFASVVAPAGGGVLGRCVRISRELDRRTVGLAGHSRSESLRQSRQHLVDPLCQRPVALRIEQHHLLLDPDRVGLRTAPLRPICPASIRLTLMRHRVTWAICPKPESTPAPASRSTKAGRQVAAVGSLERFGPRAPGSETCCVHVVGGVWGS